MKNTMKKFAFAALAAVALAAVVAHATTFEECQQSITSLKAQTNDIQLTGKKAETKDRPGMIAILDAASLYLSQAKFGDAINKLGNYKTKVNDQLKANQINTDPAQGLTAQDLLNGADNAIARIRDLSTQSSTSDSAIY